MVDEIGQRVRRVDQRIAVVGGKFAGSVERAVGVLGRADARGRGAEDERDPRRAVALARREHGVDEAVAGQAEPGQPVVAALPGSERLRQRRGFEAGDAADPGRQRARPEVVRRQRAAARAQGGEQGVFTGTGGRRCRVGRDLEGGDGLQHGSLREGSAIIAMLNRAPGRARTGVPDTGRAPGDVQAIGGTVAGGSRPGRPHARLLQRPRR